jgi:hypothetical protein
MRRFSIVLLIRHPSMDPKDISEALGLTPHSSWKAGEPRLTPRGTVLPGPHKLSSWNHIRQWAGDHSFAKEVENFVLELSVNRDFFTKLASEQARCELFVQLPGDASQGDSLSPSVLRQIHDLGLYFGVEVFPDYAE